MGIEWFRAVMRGCIFRVGWINLMVESRFLSVNLARKSETCEYTIQRSWEECSTNFYLCARYVAVVYLWKLWFSIVLSVRRCSYKNTVMNKCSCSILAQFVQILFYSCTIYFPVVQSAHVSRQIKVSVKQFSSAQHLWKSWQEQWCVPSLHM